MHENRNGTTQPPDRAALLTEQRNERTRDLHRLTVAECVARITDEDRAITPALEAAQPALTAFLEEAAPRFLAGGRLVYVGAGTSGRLGVLDAAEVPPTFQVPPGRVIGIIAGGDAALRRSSEEREDDSHGAAEDLRALSIGSKDTILGIAAGGTTPYVLGALEYAKHLAPSCLTGLLVCVPILPPPTADHVIALLVGPEVIAGSTRMKAGTATKLALNLISTTLMIRSGRVYQNLMVDLRASNAKLRDRACRIVSELTGLARSDAFALLGRAGGAVKTAVVMHRLAVEREGAEAVLRAAGGRLDAALGEAQLDAFADGRAR